MTGFPMLSCQLDWEAVSIISRREVDGWETVLSLKQPLELNLRPAEELGEVYVYYEYWFDDGNTTVRTPVALRCER